MDYAWLYPCSGTCWALCLKGKWGEGRAGLMPLRVSAYLELTKPTPMTIPEKS